MSKTHPSAVRTASPAPGAETAERGSSGPPPCGSTPPHVPRAAPPDAPGPQGGGAAPAPGSRIHQYEIIRQIGAGGMGAVFLARDTRLGRRAAIKFLHSRD